MSGHQALSMSRHDEQRVVDPDAESDQQRELRRELRHLHYVAEQNDEACGDAERRPCG